MVISSSGSPAVSACQQDRSSGVILIRDPPLGNVARPPRSASARRNTSCLEDGTVLLALCTHYGGKTNQTPPSMPTIIPTIIPTMIALAVWYHRGKSRHVLRV